MRTVAVVVAIAFLAGCGSAVDPGAEGEPTDDRATPVSTSVSSPDSLVTTTTTTTTTTVPGQAVALPEDGITSDDELRSRLSIEDALLPDDAFDPPWEPQGRNLDVRGYDVGPNQTDCEDYWVYEQLLAGGGGHAMWWIDGGNANHRVIRIDDVDETLGLLQQLAALTENCALVNWNEGGSFTVEAFTPDLDGFIMRFDDRASGEVTWVAITLYRDLLSVLRIPLWTRADGTMLDITLEDVTTVAAEMTQRLQDAGPDRAPPPTTTTTTTPPPPPPPLDVPPTTVVALDELGRLLLSADDAPGWLRFNEVDPSTPGSGDEEFVETCPAGSSLDDIDQAATWLADFTTLEGGDALQLVGEMGDAGEASDVVARFAEVAACDLSILLPGATGSGGPVEIVGADVAGTLFIESPELPNTRLELGAAAIGSIVVVFTIEAQDDPAAADARLLEFMSLGIDKIVSR